MTEYKIILFGQDGVGKSSTVIQLINSHFPFYDYDPTIEDNYRRQLIVEKEICIIDVLDTSNVYETEETREKMIGEAQGFIIMYSIENEQSFLKVDHYLQSISKFKKRETNEIPILIVANKIDLENDQRVISTEKGKQLASKSNSKYLEISAKSTESVMGMYNTIIKQTSSCFPNLKKKYTKKKWYKVFDNFKK
ncbi:ras-like protein [Anaeramoeba flamelloides]|uniref:Ras-like protein n=1 Tax=Anaeramoeba flamelloides TaxID=1746091 RepID=A0ABQ8Z0Y5_9EUKA|nr:ras-like protein [Anaeramoeba flamelloides]